MSVCLGCDVLALDRERAVMSVLGSAEVSCAGFITVCMSDFLWGLCDLMSNDAKCMLAGLHGETAPSPCYHEENVGPLLTRHPPCSIS
jgi:hypothetical protein